MSSPSDLLDSRSNPVETFRRRACVAPDDPALLELKVGGVGARLGDRASQLRMQQVLSGGETGYLALRMQRAVQAGRMDLMPPHWLTRCVAETAELKALVQSGDQQATDRFLADRSRETARRYFPEFRAIEFLHRTNSDPALSRAVLPQLVQTGVPRASRQIGHEWDDAATVLERLRAVARWEEKSDTISARLNSAPTGPGSTKRIRSGRFEDYSADPVVARLTANMRSVMARHWSRLADQGLVEECFGLAHDPPEQTECAVFLHVNEILAGPVLGPHIHSGTKLLAEGVYPMISGVFYPQDVPEDPDAQSGYIEFGRPDFEVPFKPLIRRIRPTEGMIALFPAFIYHGVVPIRDGPRYSVNVDAFFRRQGAASWGPEPTDSWAL